MFPLGQGDKEGRSIADTIITAFGHKAVAGIVYRSPYLRNRGREDAWATLELVIPLYYDGSEVRPAGSPTVSTLGKEAMANAVRTFFDTNITTGLSVPTAWDNAVFSPPNGTTWTRFSMVETKAETIEGGTNRRYRTPGAAVAQVFSPLGVGEKDALSLADSIAGVFRATTVDGILFHTPRILTLGRLSDRWWQLNVTCPFSYDTISA